MDFSIIIPMANAAATVGEQLSALAQQRTEASFEVIVSDNGSTDASREVVAWYASELPSLRVVDSSARRGPSHARNVGAEVAEGDYLVFVDADDIVADGWLEAIHLAVQGGAMFIGGSLDYRRLAPSSPVEPQASYVERFPPPLGFLPWTPSCNIAIRRDLFEEAGRWDPRIERGEDVAFCWMVQLAGYPLTFVPDAMLHYRLRADLKGYLRQQLGNGQTPPLLLREFGSFGARRDPFRRVLGRWSWLLRSSPGLLRSRAERWAWLGRAAVSLGRITGSVRYRVFCP